MTHDTYQTCYGCPFRREGCHGKCEGYQARVKVGQERNDERRASIRWLPEEERLKRLKNLEAERYNKRRKK